MSCSAARTSEVAPRPMRLGLPRMAALMGVKKPFAAGRITDACRSLPTSICSVFKGTLFRRRTL